MSHELTVRPEAVSDVEAAAAWYSSERVDLALAFVDYLGHLLARIREAPFQFPEVAAGVRRAIMTRFPYGIFFTPAGNRVVVLGVLHLHRHPDTWRSRR